MLLAFFSVVHASCLAQPPRTGVYTKGLGPTTPILLESSWGDATHLANRVRVRGPDGELVSVRYAILGLDARIVPETSWTPGVYTVEERGDYDVEGRRLHHPRAEVDHAGWFPLVQLEATAAVPELPVPTDIEWTRSGMKGFSMLLAKAKRAPGAAWMTLEVEGVGEIAQNALEGIDGRILLGTFARARCNDTLQRMHLPAAGDLRAQVVAHGAHGERSAGAWVELGPGSPSEGWRDLQPAAPPSGVATDVSKLQTWTAIHVKPDGQPTVGGTVLRGTRERFGVPETWFGADAQCAP